jgi:hypothetical protein
MDLHGFSARHRRIDLNIRNTGFCLQFGEDFDIIAELGGLSCVTRRLI